MAEFCLDCLNRINESNEPARKYIISKDLDLCEGCGEWKHTVIMYRKAYWLHKLRFVIFPFKVIGIIIYVFLSIPLLPWIIYKRNKKR